MVILIALFLTFQIILNREEYQCPNSSTYFSTVKLSCLECGDNEVVYRNNCACNSTSMRTDEGCLSCEPSQIVDYNGLYCLDTCDDCDECTNRGGIIVTNLVEGLVKNTAECIECADNYYAGLDTENSSRPVYICKKCPPNKIRVKNTNRCECSSSTMVEKGDICIPANEWTNFVNTIDGMNNLGYATWQITNSSRSATITFNFAKDNLEKHLYLCHTEYIQTSCLVAVFICTVTMDLDSVLCNLVKNTFSKSNLPLGLTNTETYFSSSHSQDVNIGENMHIQTFDSAGNLESTELFNFNIFKCKNNAPQKIVYKVNYRYECSIPLSDINPKFHRFFVKDSLGDAHIIPIAIKTSSFSPKVKDYYNNPSTGLAFHSFLFDEFNVQDTAPIITRRLKSFSLMYFNNPSIKNEIYLPIIEAEYEDLIQIKDTNSTLQVSLTFNTLSNAYNIAIIIIFVVVVFGCLVFTLIIVTIRSKNDRIAKDKLYYLRFFGLTFIRYWAIGVYLYMFGIWMYWLFAYKIITGTSVVFSSEAIFSSEYYFIRILIGLVAVFLAIWMLFKIIEQGSFKLKIIDWEKPNLPVRFDGSGSAKKTSVWRYIMFLNELREETINIGQQTEFILFFVLVLFLGTPLHKASYGKTDSHIKNWELYLEASRFFRFFLIQVIMIGCNTAFYVYNKVTDHFKGASYENLIDMCYVCNISIAVFIGKDRVCYVHGKNNFGSGEGNLPIIYKKLELEAQDNVKRRGLVENDHAQVFDVYNVRYGEMEEDGYTQDKFIEQLKDQIEHSTIQIKKKDVFTRIFGVFYKYSEQQTTEKSNNIHFYKEKNAFLLKILLRGVIFDFKLLIFMTVAIFDWLSNSIAAGVLIGYVIQKLLIALRNRLTIKNMSVNNKMDKRFLI